MLRLLLGQFGLTLFSRLLLRPDFLLQVNDDFFVSLAEKQLRLFQTQIFTLQLGDCFRVLGGSCAQFANLLVQPVHSLRLLLRRLLQLTQLSLQPVSLLVDEPDLLQLYFEFIFELLN